MELSKHSQNVEIFAKNYIKNNSLFKGKHILLELYGCNTDKLDDELYLRCKINNAARLANAQLLNLVSHKFEPYGVTAIALLAESHISIHTWPEAQYAAVDIFTCGNQMKPYDASQLLIDTLAATNHVLKTINRDYPVLIENQMRKNI